MPDDYNPEKRIVHEQHTDEVVLSMSNIAANDPSFNSSNGFDPAADAWLLEGYDGALDDVAGSQATVDPAVFLDEMISLSLFDRTRRDVALALAKAGIPIFPCRVGGKEPACKHAFKDATTDLEQVEAWWSEADYNIGMEPERIGLAVVDVDGEEGLANWQKRVNQDGAGADTLVVRTPRGGLHVYFEGSLPSTTNKIAPKIDTRGRGGYVLVPPSVVNGKPYQVEGSEAVKPLPDFLKGRRVDLSTVNGAERTKPAREPDPLVELDQRVNVLRAQVYLYEQIDDGNVPADGSRNDHTMRMARKLGDFGLSDDTIVELLEDWASHGQPPDEPIWQIVNSANNRRESPRGKAVVKPGSGRSDEEAFGPYIKGQATPDVASADGPAFYNLADPAFRAAVFPRPAWVWENRLLAGRPNLYTGDAGTGKTTLAVNIGGVSVVDGATLLGATVAKEHVVMLAAEDDYGTLRAEFDEVIREAGGNPAIDGARVDIRSVETDPVPGGHILAKVTDDGTIIESPFMKDVVRPKLESIEGPILFIIDPLSEFVIFDRYKDIPPRALATTWLRSICNLGGPGRITVLVNDHPSKASMESGAHYAGNVQMKAAFAYCATLIGGDWSVDGSGRKQRELTFKPLRAKYAAEEDVTLRRVGGSAVLRLPTDIPPSRDEIMVYEHILERLEWDEPTGKDGHSNHGPRSVAMLLKERGATDIDETRVKKAMERLVDRQWLVWNRGSGAGSSNRIVGHYRRGGKGPELDALREPLSGYADMTLGPDPELVDTPKPSHRVYETLGCVSIY